MNVDHYLKRIRYTGPREPTLETLQALHRAHLYAVPFENLSIHSGETIVLNHPWLYEKIVNRGRGGFCYECNGLFSWLLEQLGYNVTLLSARVRGSSSGEFGQEFDHLTLRVDLDDPWLADVGFGEGFREPLQLFKSEEQSQVDGKYKIIEVKKEFTYLRFDAGAWQSQYQFSLQPRAFSDFIEMCDYHQTSPLSSFTQNWMCSIATPEGRTTLTNNQFIETINHEKSIKELSETESRYETLKSNFRIEGVRLIDVEH